MKWLFVIFSKFDRLETRLKSTVINKKLFFQCYEQCVFVCIIETKISTVVAAPFFFIFWLFIDISRSVTTCADAHGQIIVKQIITPGTILY